MARSNQFPNSFKYDEYDEKRHEGPKSFIEPELAEREADGYDDWFRRRFYRTYPLWYYKIGNIFIL